MSIKLPTRTEFEAFKPTPAQRKAAQVTFEAMAYQQTMAEVIVPLQEAALWEIKAINTEDGTPIREAKHTYLMSDKQFKEYREIMEWEYSDKGFKVEKDHCPLLMADHALTLAQQALIDLMAPFTGIGMEELAHSGDFLDSYDKLVELNLQLLAKYLKEVA